MQNVTRLLWLTIFLFCGSLSAQTAQIEEAYIPNESVPEAKADASADVVFLVANYSTIKYPAFARENGVTANFAVDYTVLRNGKLKVDAVLPVDPGIQLDSLPSEEVVTVIAYSINGRQTLRVPKEGTKRYERFITRQKEGLETIAQEIILVLQNLPNHEPAKMGGRALNRSYRKYFRFMLE